MMVTSNVDLSPTFGPVRNQGVRPTCLAMSLSDINQHASSVRERLSPEYLYRAAANLMPDWVSGGSGLDLACAVQAVSDTGQPLDSACPYLSHEPLEKPPALPTHLPKDMYRVKVSQESVDGPGIVASIASGRPVGLILKLTQTFYQPIESCIEYSVHVLQNRIHAVVGLGVGEHQVTREPHVLIRNSWGTGWGNAGNAWIPLQYIQAHGLRSFRV